jgi:oxygen-independent coproporphyrinogen-3 oxidase
MDHFALPEDDLARAQQADGLHRNFMGYTTHADSDLIGLGVSAISHVGDSYSQNFRDLASWEGALDRGRLPLWRGMALDADDVLRADIIQSLMCQGRIDIAAIEEHHHIDFSDYFSAALQRLEPLMADGLVTISPSRISSTSRGRLLMRIIAMCFDRYLHAASGSPAEQPRYSRAI